MSVDLIAVENQLLGGISIIYQSLNNKELAMFDEPLCYRNHSIQNLYMIVGKLPVDGAESDLRYYYAIGFQTPKHRYVTDAIEVIIRDSGTYLRFQGVEIKTADSKSGILMDTQEQLNWIKIIVQSNAELLAVLNANEDFNNVNKKGSK